MIWRLWLALAAALALLVIAAGCYVARAQPPEHADPALAPWFQGLHTEDGQGCCSQADCRPVEYRPVGNHYEVLIGEQFPGVTEPRWEEVPPEAVLNKHDNPTGRPIACVWYGKVLCFVRPEES